MMTWASLIVTLLKLVSALTQWARDQGLINATQTAQAAELMVEQAHAIDTGLRARLAQRAANASGVQQPDPFQRD